MRRLLMPIVFSTVSLLVTTHAIAGSPIEYWTGKGEHFFGGKCCYCVQAQRHEVDGGQHIFWVDGKRKVVAPHQVRITPDPKGQTIYYCSGGLHLPNEVPFDRCGLIRGSG